MTSGWIIFALVGCVVLCSGIVLAAAVMKAAWAQKERESLTSSDLRALEESAMLLIEQLKEESDRGIAEMDRRMEILRQTMAEADAKIRTLCELQEAVPAPKAPRPQKAALGNPNRQPDVERIISLHEEGLSAAEISKTTGVDCALVNFVLSLAKTQGEGQ